MADETESSHKLSVLRLLVVMAASGAAGAATLTQELLAAGWLAPWGGSGPDVWAAILGVSMGALAAGYAAGSWCGPRAGRLDVVAILLSIAACGVWLGRAFGVAEMDLQSDPANWILAVRFLALPLLSLGAVSPCLVDVLARGDIGAGRAAGWVLSAGTLGGVAGALVSGMQLLPWWGLNQTALFSCWLLLAAAWFCALAHRPVGRASLVMAAAATALVAWTQLTPTSAPSEPTDDSVLLERCDGLLGRCEVFDEGLSRVMKVNGIPQTRTARLTGDWPLDPERGSLIRSGNFFELLPYLRPKGRRALLIGLGGGALVKHLRSYRWEVTCVEIDPNVVEFAREHFGFTGECTVEDGRRFLRRAPGDWDFILVDVYRGEHLPSHLVTREFFRLACTRLSPEGLLALNLIGARRAPDVLAVLRTVGAVFPHMALYAPGGGDQIGPMTLIAGVAPLEVPSTRDRLAARGLAMPVPLALTDPGLEGAPLLTDDTNPLPVLRRPTARTWRAAVRRQQSRFPGKVQ